MHHGDPWGLRPVGSDPSAGSVVPLGWDEAKRKGEMYVLTPRVSWRHPGRDVKCVAVRPGPGVNRVGDFMFGEVVRLRRLTILVTVVAAASNWLLPIRRPRGEFEFFSNTVQLQGVS